MYFDQEAFGKRLKELRNIKGMTQEELAEKVNITREHLGRLERGKYGCSIDLLIELSYTLNASTDYLLLGRNPDRDRLSPSWKESGPRPRQKAASAGHQPAVGHRKKHVKRPFEVSILNDKFNDKPIRIGYNRARGSCLRALEKEESS